MTVPEFGYAISVSIPLRVTTSPPALFAQSPRSGLTSNSSFQASTPQRKIFAAFVG